MTDDLHPQDGARFLMEREEQEGDAATYSAAIYTPSDCFQYRAVLSVGGHVELASDAAAPDELEKRLHNIAASLARAAKGNREAGLPAFPQRILRWRGPGRG